MKKKHTHTHLENIASLRGDNANHLPEVGVEVPGQPFHPLRRHHHRLRQGCETRHISEEAHRVILLPAGELLVGGSIFFNIFFFDENDAAPGREEGGGGDIRVWHTAVTFAGSLRV